MTGLAVSPDERRIAAFGNRAGTSDVTIWNVAEQSEVDSILSELPFVPRVDKTGFDPGHSPP